MKSTTIALAAVSILCACASQRSRVTPVAAPPAVTAPAAEAQPEPKRICVVENPRVAIADFLEAYRAALEKKGYSVTVVQRNPQPLQCPLFTRYTAFVGGSRGPLVQLDVYRDGKRVGGATSRGGYDLETDVRQLVDRLLP
jgi:hypothetical protein